MKLFEAFGLKRKAAPSLKPMMPNVNGWVDLRFGGSTVFQACVEEIGTDAIVTSRPEGVKLRPGANATFVYTNAQGKFRFSSPLLGEDATGRLRFAMPARIDSMGASGSNQRSAVRLDATVPGTWRMAAGGKGVGQFSRATIRDISRGGASVTLPCELRKGLEIEIQVLLGGATPLTLICEVMRVQRIERSDKVSHGVRFRGLSPADDRAIGEFINRRQVELRARGLV